MSRSQFFLSLCLLFVIGVGFRSWTEPPLLVGYTIFLSGLIMVILGWRRIKIRLLGLMAIFLFLGILRFELNVPKVDAKKIQFYNESAVSFMGTVIKEPDERIDHRKLTVGKNAVVPAVTGIIVDRDRYFPPDPTEAEASALKGKVLIKTGLYPEYQYGDQLEITCNLKKPEQINDFDYPGYLRGENIYSVCYYPKIKLIAQAKGNPIYQKILAFKNRLKSVIDTSLPEPEASLFSALALGSRGGLTNELRENFQKTGTSHIIAISGLHITLISGFLSTLLLLFISNRKRAFILSFLILSLFIVLIGFRASAVRAGAMGFLAGLAPYISRRKSSFNALVFIGALMILISPQILRFDLGFQLSFLATLGIIYIIPVLTDRFSFLKRETLNFRGFKISIQSLRSILLMTISAQIMTLPWIIHKFKIVSLVSILTNILILMVIPLLIPLGLMASLIGLIWSPLGQMLFWPTWFLLAYVLKVVEFFSSLPWSALTIKNLPLAVVLLMYGGIYLFLVKLKFRSQNAKC